MADTLMYFKKLEEAGFTRKQAEAQVEIVTDYNNSTVATKLDILKSESELRKEFQGLRDEFRALEYNLKGLEARLTIRLGGMIVIGLGALAALIKLT